MRNDNIEAIYPLTPVQQGILFHVNYDQQSNVYIESLQFDLHGPLDAAALKTAWQRLVDHHTALRTFFVWENRETPLQIVRKQADLPWEELDWQHLPEQEQQKQFETLHQAEQTSGFDLTQAPLMRLKLIRRSANSWRLLLSYHHLVLDGWSVTLLLDEVFAHYRAIKNNTVAQLPDPRPYKDYALWLQQQDTSAAEAYWRKTLRGFTTPTPLGDDLAPTNAQFESTAYSFQVQQVPEHVSTQLKSIAQRNKISLNTLFQGAWALLLSRYSGETDIVFGSAVSGRTAPLPGIETMVGLFISSLPVRAKVTPQASLVNWLQELQAQQTQARQFEHSSLQEIQGWSDMQRAQGEALFDSIVSFNNFEFDGVLQAELDGVAVDNLVFSEGSHYPITVLVDPGTETEIRINFDCSRFQADTIGRMLTQFKALLTGIADNPNQLLADYSLLTSMERQQLLVEFNQTEGVVSAENSVIDLFEQQSAQTPDATAVRFGDHTLTYQQVNKQANQLAHFLQDAGIGPEKVVALCLERSPLAIIAILGTLKAGGAYLPLDPTLPPRRLAHMLGETETPVILTTATRVANLPDTTARVIRLDTEWETIATHSSDTPSAAATGDNLAYIIYTSGSTGLPKGAMIRHSNLLNYVSWARDFYLQGEKLSFPLFSALSFDLTVTSIFVPLVSGGTIVVYGESQSGNLAILDVVGDNLVDIIKLTPAHLTLIQELDLENTRIRKLIVGGEDFKRSLAASMQAQLGDDVEIYNEYGPTEATVGCMIHRFDPATDQDGSVPIGKPIRNAQLYILDQHLTPVPPGITGEMCVGGAGVARGYLKRADLTAAKFVENPFNTGTTLYRTGDLARWSPDGQMQFLGRADDQVKVKGYRVELGEVESTLLTHSDVVSAVVTVFQPENALSATPEKQCVQCGLPDNYPGAEFDDNGVCDTCREYNALKIRFEPYFKTVDDLQPILERAKTGRQGQYDCLVLYSGGKDSSFMLYQLVRELGMTPLVFSLDNGYISEEAKTNMRRVTDDLGVDLVFGRTPHMNAVFVDSLKRHSNVCDGCFKVIYTLGISLARQKGINTIFTGLSRGQLFETRLSDMFHARIFDVDEIDRTVLEARKAYHRFDDAVTQLMDVSIFEDDQIFKDVQLVDFYRYTDVPLQEMYRYLDENAPWVRPSDTGRSTNCLINDAGIYIHKKTRGYHNYALPYSWDVRVGHKTRSEAVDELDDDLDETRVRQMLAEIGYDESENNRIQLAGYVVTRQPVSVTVLRDHLASYLPDYMLPTYLMQLDQLPLTPNGKVDRRALPRPEFGRIQVDTAFVAPDSTVEIQLADIWSEVLGAERVGVHDNFFELGGDSISTIRVTMRVSQAFQIELRPVALFEKPTVAQLADHIEAILIAEIEQMSDEEVELLLSKLD